jgi:paraquat-inducible protein A
MENRQHLTACPDCDLLIDLQAVPVKFNAICPRCRHIIYEAHPDAIQRGLALSIGGLLLFPLAVFLPLMTLSRMGLTHAGSIAEGIHKLYSGGYWFMASMVLLCAVLAPLLELSVMFVISALLWLKKRSPYLIHLMKTLHAVREWAMLEVLMMGIMVSLVKLKDMATLEFGMGLVCMVLTLLCVVLIQVLVDEHELWESITDNSAEKTQSILSNKDCNGLTSL